MANTYTIIHSIYRDLNLEKEELSDIVSKVERVMRSTEYQSIPPIVYQLVLATQAKLPGVALKAVITYFNVQENKLMANEIKEAEARRNVSTSQAIDDISSADNDVASDGKI